MQAILVFLLLLCTSLLMLIDVVFLHFTVQQNTKYVNIGEYTCISVCMPTTDLFLLIIDMETGFYDECQKGFIFPKLCD